MKSKQIFLAFLAQLKKYPKLPALYSQKHTIQSSVGLIFQCKSNKPFENIKNLMNEANKIDEVSLLFTQRAGYQKDSNKYNIVLPGGQADSGQTDFQACKRQLQEQIALKVDEECLYMGRLPKNFYYSQKRGKFVYISCHVWILNNQSKYVPILNKQQLCNYRWVPLSQMVDLDNIVQYQQKQMGIFRRMNQKYSKVTDKIKQNLESVYLPSLKIGMGRELWGLTLWIWVYILLMSKKNMEAAKYPIGNIQRIQKFYNSCKSLQINFRKSFFFAYPIKVLSYAWHRHYRINQFKYPQPRFSAFWIFSALFLMIFLLVLH